MTKYGVELWWNEKGKKKALVIPKSKITTEISFFPETYQLGEENNSKIRENEQGHWINRLIQGDNFVIMQQLLDEGFENSIDLIYIDPPFFTGNDTFHKIFKENNTGKIISSSNAFRDHWQGLESYLQFMYDRFHLMKKLLAPTGSIFVHCDWHAGHYLKLLLDEVFGYQNFKNEIIWCYTGAGQTPRYFARKHDTIFWYVKNPSRYTFNINAVRVPYKKSNLAAGRTSYAGRKSEEYLKSLDKRGKILEDWWTDIATIGYSHSEITGFATQKPERLLERIIRACSNEGDLIADFFCGSGTTIVVAEKLNRRWIATDMSAISLNVTLKRLLSLHLGRNLEITDKLVPHSKKAHPFTVQKLVFPSFYEMNGDLPKKIKHLILKWLDARVSAPPLDGYRDDEAQAIKITFKRPEDRDFQQLCEMTGKLPNHVESLAWIAPTWDLAILDEWKKMYHHSHGIELKPLVIPRVDELAYQVQQEYLIESSLQKFKKVYRPIPMPRAEIKFKLSQLADDDSEHALYEIHVSLKQYEFAVGDLSFIKLKGVQANPDPLALIDYWMVGTIKDKNKEFVPIWASFRSRRNPTIENTTKIRVECNGADLTGLKIIDMLGIKSWWLYH